MDFELDPTITLREGSFNVLVVPRELLIQALSKNLNLQRYKVLYVSGNCSGILSKLDRRLTELEVRRGFTVFQLMSILEDPTIHSSSSSMIPCCMRMQPKCRVHLPCRGRCFEGCSSPALFTRC